MKEKTRDLMIGTAIAIVVVMGISTAARLPTVGGDNNAWGNILNEFLNISFDSNGTMRENTINSSHIIDSSINASDIAPESINASHLQNGAIDAAAKIANGIITAAKLVTGIITSDYISIGAVNGSHISAGAITGSHISSTSNLTVNNINATTFALGIENKTASCSTVACTAVINCSAGKAIITGLTSDSTTLCGTSPLNCNAYCTPGSTSCSATAILSSASAYAICGKIN